MSIRRAVTGDANALYVLERDLFDEANYPLSKKSFYYHIRRNLLLVAEDSSGEIVGYALALVGRRRVKLYSLGVAKSHRRGGVARMLLKSLLTQLQQEGLTHTVLEVRCDNLRAMALYEKAGFRIARRLEGFYRDGTDAFFMEIKDVAQTLQDTL